MSDDENAELVHDWESDCYVLRDEIARLRAELAAVTAERDRMREALLFAELMASEMGVDPREKCQRIYDDLHAKRAALEGVTEPPR